MTKRSVNHKMSPRTKKQFEEIRSQSQTHIINRALSLFASKGFASTSVADIAREAGVSKGLMYNYFPSKEKLLLAIIGQALAELGQTMEKAVEIEDPAKRLEALVRSTFGAAKKDTERWRLFQILSLYPETIEVGGLELQNGRMQMIGIYQSILTELNFPKPELEVWILGALFEGILTHFFEAPEDYPLDDVLDEVIKRYCKPYSG